MMRFRPGDKVKFKDEAGTGIVTRVDEKGLVYVEAGDGFERPVMPEDLILTRFPADMEMDREEPQQETPQGSSQKEGVSSGSGKKEGKGKVEPELPPAGEGEVTLYVGVVQRDERFAFYLINDSDYHLHYTFSRLRGPGRAELLDEGSLEEGMKILLAELVPEGDQVLAVQGLLYGRRFVPRPPLDRQIPFGSEAVPRAREFKENPYFDEKAWLVPLLPEKVHLEVPEEEQEKKKLIRSKGDLQPPRKKMMIRPHITGPEPVEEVDLHIEAIVEESRDLSNGEILEIQLARFETVLEGAIRAGQKKIVFIHGLGQGRLKNEIRKRLDKRGIAYQDAPFKEYGYGATVAVLKKG